LPHIESLKRILDKEGSQTTAFEIQVGGVGAFPDLRKPRVIWIGIQAPTSLADLQRRIDRETVRLGYESEERAFSPHLTLGRLSRDASPEDGRRVGQVLSGMQTGTLGSVTVNEIHLYQSDLRPGGAIYTLIHRAELITKNIYSTAR
jgi:2'-5' RNA ligase